MSKPKRNNNARIVPYPPRKGTCVCAIKPGSFAGMVWRWPGGNQAESEYNAARINVTMELVEP